MYVFICFNIKTIPTKIILYSSINIKIDKINTVDKYVLDVTKFKISHFFSVVNNSTDRIKLLRA